MQSFVVSVACNSSRNTWNKPNSSVQHLGIAGGTSWLLNPVENIWRGHWMSSDLRKKQERDGERLWIPCQHFPGKHRALPAGFVQQREAGAGFKHRKSQRAAAKEGLNPRQTRGRRMNLQAKFPGDGRTGGSCLTKTLYFLLFFFWGKCLKKPDSALIISSLRCLEQGQFLSSGLPVPPGVDELLERHLEISFHFGFPSSSSASVLMIQRGLEVSPAFLDCSEAVWKLPSLHFILHKMLWSFNALSEAVAH